MVRALCGVKLMDKESKTKDLMELLGLEESVVQMVMAKLSLQNSTGGCLLVLGGSGQLALLQTKATSQYRPEPADNRWLMCWGVIMGMCWGVMMGMFLEGRWNLKWRKRRRQRGRGGSRWRRRAGWLVWRRMMPGIETDGEGKWAISLQKVR